ncbi:FIST signal transduction protein [Pontivivens insulae]|uniref:FIST C-domain domain-containing protein n=1 Tax=Pontivivens insulae TaxID=1639689 RepID=A0A2R8A6U4_9RHOB|nr:FIST N-terminal domain-containing protein [Pontivivens insulae]RED18074.1 hypothetical protein DFR53_0266 [Pontivivens insulae]SPF27971.1 hypothetical protein POI8812_00266 [Pontivivens insulae]
MKIDVINASLSDGADSLAAQISALPEKPSFISVQLNCELDPAAIIAAADDAALIGATSALGSMSDAGPIDGAVAFCISDADGDYGVGTAALADDATAAARQATTDALRNADRIGEQPALVWVMTTPGREEAVLAGIEAVVTAHVPIIGGSAADNTVSGDWFVFGQDVLKGDAVAVAVLFPSGPVQHAYQNGYAPTEHSGTVTRAEGRHVLELDGKPAMDVYREWTADSVPAAPPSGDEPRAILAESTLWPLGREIGSLNNVPQYLLAHPSGVDSAGGLHLFADVAEGETLVQMSGSIGGLVSRAGRVATLAKDAGSLRDRRIAGALMVYCGGCMFAVRDHIDAVCDGVADALPETPFAGYFSFGEQGPVVGGENRHGNLMISCIVFGEAS